MNRSRAFTALGAAMVGGALVLALSGCAGSAAPAADAAGGDAPPAVPASNPAAPGEVLGQGTVLQVDGEEPMFCLGAVMESYPPQCSGPEIVGWDWTAVDGSESASGVTWGTYAVQGTWDGTKFTVTQPPIMLALYDPMKVVDPFTDPANAGSLTEAELADLQEKVNNDEFVEALASWPENGYLFVQVIYDDGSVQDYFDAVHGEDVVQVRSALRDLES
ncbi:hypothetical protein ACFFGH_25455 [Lysobacter korlensis]|uniref:Lipoprotein n=1 Tax=Lysobacter korlensis TaxID=553636 RepID=A0ABV6RW33_9GAMM